MFRVVIAPDGPSLVVKDVIPIIVRIDWAGGKAALGARKSGHRGEARHDASGTVWIYSLLKAVLFASFLPASADDPPSYFRADARMCSAVYLMRGRGLEPQQFGCTPQISLQELISLSSHQVSFRHILESAQKFPECFFSFIQVQARRQRKPSPCLPGLHVSGSLIETPDPLGLRGAGGHPCQDGADDQ